MAILRAANQWTARRLPGVYSVVRRLWFNHLASPRYVFTRHYEQRTWGRGETRSGFGSTLESTENLRRELPSLVRELGVRSLVDVACGDFNWMRRMELPIERYLGLDVVASMIESNREQYGDERTSFEVRDITRDTPPRSDLVLCRDCLVHLSNRRVLHAMKNIASSGSTWVAATTAPWVEANVDICTGEFRPIDLEKAPFNLPKPSRLMFDGSEAGRIAFEQGRHRSPKLLGLWKIEALDVPG